MSILFTVKPTAQFSHGMYAEYCPLVVAARRTKC